MAKKLISNLVFTKNRPLQLHGYLESLRRFMPADAIETYIIYKQELFSEEYQRCFGTFADCTVIREINFHRDFLTLLGALETPYILFGIDDVVYFDGVGTDVIEGAFRELGPELFGFTLRLDKSHMPDDFTAGNVEERILYGQPIFAVDWTRGRSDNTRYPFELCATVYRTTDIRRLLQGRVSPNRLAQRFLLPGSPVMTACGRLFRGRKVLKRLGFFFNPNTLESWCCRYVQQHPEQFGHYLAYQKMCAIAIQVNTVNTSTRNTSDGTSDHTVEALNAKYKQGYRLDVDFVAKDKPKDFSRGHEFLRLAKGAVVE